MASSSLLKKTSEMMPFSALNLCVIVIIINVLPRLDVSKRFVTLDCSNSKNGHNLWGPSQLTLWLSSKGTIHLSQEPGTLPVGKGL